MCLYDSIQYSKYMCIHIRGGEFGIHGTKLHRPLNVSFWRYREFRTWKKSRNSVKFRGISRNHTSRNSAEFRRNCSQFRTEYGIDGSKKNRRNSVSAEFRGHPSPAAVVWAPPVCWCDPPPPHLLICAPPICWFMLPLSVDLCSPYRLMWAPPICWCELPLYVDVSSLYMRNAEQKNLTFTKNI